MGHLINPVSMRVGFSRYWEDIWYIENIYYPEYLHVIFKIRLFLIYFFGLKNIEKLGIFYSHFTILKYYKTLSLNVYFYHGVYESLLDFFFDESLIKFKQYNFDERLKQPLWYNNIFNIITLSNLIFSSLNEKLDYNRILNFVKKGDTLGLKLLMNNVYFKGISKHMRARLLFLLGIYIKIRKYLILQKNFVLKIAVTKFLYLVLWNYTFGPTFSYVKTFLNLVFSSFAVMYVLPKMYIISNKNVTAKFLSRFMARKLQQNYRVMEIANPIRRELKNIAFCGNSSSLAKVSPKYYEFYRGIFRKILLVLQNIFKYEFANSYKNHGLWLNFDFFFISLLNKEIYSLKNRIIGLSKIYIKNKANFFLFFNQNSKIFEKIYSLMLTQWNSILLNPILNLKNFYEKSFNYFKTFNNFFFRSANLLVKDSLVCAFNYYLQRFFAYSYYNYNYKWILAHNNLSKLKMRLARPKNNLQRLLGFKFHFVGRFSRKQRAASIWFKEGFMPLNTLKCDIDYGCYNLPLKNSAINVKVWIYRTSCFIGWSYKVA